MQVIELKPIKIKVGEVLLLKPSINDKRQHCYVEEMPGTIVYINRKHRFFTAEFKFKYGSFRESYKFIERGDLACLTV